VVRHPQQVRMTAIFPAKNFPAKFYFRHIIGTKRGRPPCNRRPFEADSSLDIQPRQWNSTSIDFFESTKGAWVCKYVAGWPDEFMKTSPKM
jgi:hypothetical protein